jgi:hypothetical protein
VEAQSMTIAFVFLPGNTEVQLLDDDGRIEDRFYTACRKFGFGGPFRYKSDRDPLMKMDARFAFEFMEEMMPDPVIGGSLSAFHPYWAERAARRKAKEEGRP